MSKTNLSIPGIQLRSLTKPEQVSGASMGACYRRYTVAWKEAVSAQLRTGRGRWWWVKSGTMLRRGRQLSESSQWNTRHDGSTPLTDPCSRVMPVTNLASFW